MPDSFVKAESKPTEALRTSHLRCISSEKAFPKRVLRSNKPVARYQSSESSSSESDAIDNSKTVHTPSLPKNDSFVKAESKPTEALQTSHLRCISSEKALSKRVLAPVATYSSSSESSSSESDAIVNSKRIHTPGLSKNDSFVRTESKSTKALQTSQLSSKSSQKASQQEQHKQTQPARCLPSVSSSSESDAIDNSKRLHTPGLPKKYQSSCNTSKLTSNSFNEHKATGALQTCSHCRHCSHLRHDSSEKAFPKRLHKRNKRARHQSSESSSSESDVIVNSKRLHTPSLPKKDELSCNTCKHTSNSFFKAVRKATEVLQTSHLRCNSSEKAFRKRFRKRNKPAARYSESSSSESETVAKRKRFHIPNVPNNDELSCNTSKCTSNSRVLTSQDQDASHENDLPPALCNRLFQYLEEINTRMGELGTKIDQLMSQVEKLSSTNSTTMSALDGCLPDDINLPVTSVEELEQLNNKLKNDKEISATLARLVFHAGYGKSPRPFILSLTRKVLAQEVAVQFSRFGRKGKKSFQNYCETLNVILDAAALKFKNVDRQDLADIFGRCLTSAPAWDQKKVRVTEIKRDLLSAED